MSKLSDEPFEKVVDDKDLIQGYQMNEAVYGCVGCDNCGYWGNMEGIIEYNEKRFIKFICPECEAVEQVRNPEYRQ